MCLDLTMLYHADRHGWTVQLQTLVVDLVRFVDNIFSRIVEIEDSRRTVGFVIGIAPRRCHVVLFVLMKAEGQG